MIEVLRRAAPLACTGLLAVALAVPAPAAAGGPSTCDLVDSSGMIWDISSTEGYASDGGSADNEYGDAFDSYGYLRLAAPATPSSYGGYWSPNPYTCTTEDGGRELVLPVDDDVNATGVDAARKVFVPASGKAFARWLDILTNPGTEPVTVNYQWYGDYGEIEETTDSADGSTSVELGERWASLVQGGSDPDPASLWDGPGAVRDRWDTVADGGDVPGYEQNDEVAFEYKSVTIPAAGRAIFMHIEHQDRTVAGARAFGRAAHTNTDGLFAGMTAEEIRDVRNWTPDSDGDGVFDGADSCSGLANADQADADGDSTGDACDGDMDNDGVPNEIEAGLGSNPRSGDTDGDGRPDGDDSCPTLAGTVNGCPAPAAAPATPTVTLAASTGRALPTDVTLNVRLRRGTERLAVRTSGRIALPAGVSNAVCAGGRIAVAIKQSDRPISTRVVDVRSDCTYRSTVTFRRKLGTGSLRVKSYFFGSQGLVSRAAKSKLAKLS